LSQGRPSLSEYRRIVGKPCRIRHLSQCVANVSLLSKLLILRAAFRSYRLCPILLSRCGDAADLRTATPKGERPSSPHIELRDGFDDQRGEWNEAKS